MFRFSLPTIIALLLANVGASLAQTPDIPHQEINLINDQPDFALFDEDFYRNQLIILGESHGFQKPQAVDLALLKHLNKRIGVRYYIAEVDPTKAYYLNQYLQTDNDSTLRLVFRSWVAETAQWANVDYYKKIQAIRAYNQTLPVMRQIRFVGIDAVQDRPLVARQLRELTQSHAAFRQDKPRIDSIGTYLEATPRMPDSLASQVAMNWLAKIRNKPKLYRNVPEATMNEIIATLSGLGYRKTIRRREPTLFANFRDAIIRLKLQTEKLYGFWGAGHIGQAPLADGSKPFAALVQESDLPMRVKIVSLQCRYVDSFMMVPTAFLPPFWQEKGKTYSRVDKFNDNGPMMTVAGIDELISLSRPNTVTLFKLAGTAVGQRPVTATYSPFMPDNQKLQFSLTRPSTDYFQYVVLIRNSDMTKPLY